MVGIYALRGPGDLPDNGYLFCVRTAQACVRFPNALVASPVFHTRCRAGRRHPQPSQPRQQQQQHDGADPRAPAERRPRLFSQEGECALDPDVAPLAVQTVVKPLKTHSRLFPDMSVVRLQCPAQRLFHMRIYISFFQIFSVIDYYKILSRGCQCHRGGPGLFYMFLLVSC